ncbi:MULTISPECIES: F0F1 ATP synthase subunit A [Desulfococcus]|jgi:F-type H+-transporting ATPase subunit a|uniref:ATP synthase subunit a n=1 Tax=Desulfococcus multivorans DSM 2059 TaxID=1121405 RepID=S7TWL6_DESML|nr:F0F1 ATP synthase subunit A [Desulfococcus multivorans]AOY56797.1 AtpA1: ATP synthase, subunit alpha [Desulfococcus multivorans]AQU99345.1 F0F1 ATP synthase subunit A [Desulfococcus multivorans]EPR41487.1 ATP synthase subunit a [Desulfococcus multivorans DSM 2059]MDX9817837.1 F0F1 ATP synthase subunit A [Desulfococcus multivorans]SJZ92402.1 ATP synthase F0 subcomplex A subunit [Desulfococcus multivorans DSM 2059]
MEITPDTIVYWSCGPFTLNATLLFTWLVMTVMSFGSWLVTRRLTSSVRISPWQNLLESIVAGMKRQLDAVSKTRTRELFPFVGTLFLFIAISNLLSVVPGFRSPTGSLSTAAALAVCVFLAVPVFGISKVGFVSYLLNYLRPTPLMLPFNVMGELSRTLALAVRLFGNMMSGSMIGAILLMIAPLVFPVLMQVLGLLTGMVQAYIFAVLAAIYISAGMTVGERKKTT